jgi:hypothetical protein
VARNPVDLLKKRTTPIFTMYLSASPLKPLAILLAYLLSASYLGVASGAVNHIREYERGMHQFNGTRTHHFNGSHHHHNESRPHHTIEGVPRPIGGHVRPEPYTALDTASDATPDASPSATPDAGPETI